MSLAIYSTTSEKVHVKIAPVDADGKPAKVDGVPAWSITRGNATVVPDDDGMGAFIVSEDAAGDSDYQVSVDADLSADGVRNITDGGTYTYSAPEASTLGLTADAAVAK